MTDLPLLLTLRVVWFLAAFLAMQLARIVPSYRRVALIITYSWGAELARMLLRILLAQRPRPFTGLARFLFHMDQGLVLLFPALSVALALMVLGWVRALRALPVVAFAWGSMLGACALAYPGLRGPGWMQVVILAQWASVTTQLLCAAISVRRALDHWMVPSLAERAVLVLVAGDVAQMLGPWLGEPIENWGIWRLQSLIVLGTLTLLEAKWIAARRSPSIAT